MRCTWMYEHATVSPMSIAMKSITPRLLYILVKRGNLGGGASTSGSTWPLFLRLSYSENDDDARELSSCRWSEWEILLCWTCIRLCRLRMCLAVQVPGSLVPRCISHQDAFKEISFFWSSPWWLDRGLVLLSRCAEASMIWGGPMRATSHTYVSKEFCGRLTAAAFALEIGSPTAVAMSASSGCEQTLFRRQTGPCRCFKKELTCTLLLRPKSNIDFRCSSCGPELTASCMWPPGALRHRKNVNGSNLQRIRHLLWTQLAHVQVFRWV